MKSSEILLTQKCSNLRGGRLKKVDGSTNSFVTKTIKRGMKMPYSIKMSLQKDATSLGMAQSALGYQ